MDSSLLENDLSYMCMEEPEAFYGKPTLSHFETETIDNIEKLKNTIECAFAQGYDRPKTHDKLLQILGRVDLTTNELNKFTFWDASKSYTRNLVATDGKNYTLLLLCWNPGKESKVHNHPCDGCYVKTVRGCIRETRYAQQGNEITRQNVRFFNEGQISYIDDSIGLHKIGNPFCDSGSVSLHLYTPPFASCKVWTSEVTWEEGTMGMFSVMGHRTPELEGKPGSHSKMIMEINNFFRKSLKFDFTTEKIISE